MKFLELIKINLGMQMNSVTIWFTCWMCGNDFEFCVNESEHIEKIPICNSCEEKKKRFEWAVNETARLYGK